MSTRELLGLMSRQLGRPVILRGEGTEGGHDWAADVRDGMPVLVCQRCPIVWWPDRLEPKKPCSSASSRLLDGGETNG